VVELIAYSRFPKRPLAGCFEVVMQGGIMKRNQLTILNLQLPVLVLAVVVANVFGQARSAGPGGGIRAYPNNPEQRNVIMAQTK
jgi:hypothetical protein